MQAHTKAKGTEKNQHKYNSAIGMPKRKVQKNGHATEFTEHATYADQEDTRSTNKMADTETRQYWGPPFSNGNDLEKHP